MDLHKIAAVLYDTAAVFFLLSAFVFPVLYARWRRRERAQAAETERTLRLLKTTTTNDHIWDA